MKLMERELLILQLVEHRHIIRLEEVFETGKVRVVTRWARTPNREGERGVSYISASSRGTLGRLLA